METLLHYICPSLAWKLTLKQSYLTQNDNVKETRETRTALTPPSAPSANMCHCGGKLVALKISTHQLVPCLVPFSVIFLVLFSVSLLNVEFPPISLFLPVFILPSHPCSVNCVSVLIRSHHLLNTISPYFEFFFLYRSFFGSFPCSLLAPGDICWPPDISFSLPQLLFIFSIYGRLSRCSNCPFLDLNQIWMQCQKNNYRTKNTYGGVLIVMF